MNDPVYTRFLAKRLARRRVLALAASGGAAALLAACNAKSNTSSPTATADASDGNNSGDNGIAQDTTVRPGGWGEDSHGNDVDPDYAMVFPADRVNQMAVVISAENWKAMLDNMTELSGARGSGGGIGGGGLGGRPNGGVPAPSEGGFQPGGVPAGGGAPAPGEGGFQPGGAPPAGGAGANPGGPGGGGGDLISQNPMWVPGTIQFNGKTWTNVGVRFKGNSSLQSSWREGTDKMPFKFDFDEFEEQFPEIKNQRFYGFKQLSLSNNFGDATGMRETVAYDLFEAAGLVAANTAAYSLQVDYGEGPKELGLYTVIEVIDDTVVKRAFEDGSGNIYEADGRAASLAQGVNAQIEASFQVEGGENADWSDIKKLYDVIHSGTRTSDAAAWRTSVEEIFEVDTFLEWLAISAAIQHWDTYGGMTHNYYLYNNPQNGKLTWISWDHNFVLSGGGAGGAGGRMGSSSLDKADVGSNWRSSATCSISRTTWTSTTNTSARLSNRCSMPKSWQSATKKWPR